MVRSGQAVKLVQEQAMRKSCIMLISDTIAFVTSVLLVRAEKRIEGVLSASARGSPSVICIVEKPFSASEGCASRKPSPSSAMVL